MHRKVHILHMKKRLGGKCQRRGINIGLEFIAKLCCAIKMYLNLNPRLEELGSLEKHACVCMH